MMSLRKSRQQKKGFTLVETMVALVILSFIVTAVALIYTGGYASYARNTQKIEVQENLRITLNKMSREIREALPLESMEDLTKTALGTAGGENPPTSPIYVTDNGTKIIFAIEEAPGQQKVISFFKSGSNIFRSVDGAGNNPVASDITGLEFNYDGLNTVTIVVKGEKLNSGEMSVKTKVLARAIAP